MADRHLGGAERGTTADGRSSPGPVQAVVGDARFARWSTPYSWPGGAVAFGSVLDSLVEGVVAFATRPQVSTYRRWSMSAAIGCVPWMNNERLTASLATLGGCFIMIDKGANDVRAVHALQSSGHALPTMYLPGFDEVGATAADGRAPVIGPWGMSGGSPPEELGPVRVAGWRGDRKAPLVHAKLLVLGDAWGYDNDEDGEWGPQNRFRPVRAWLGSANWTRGATDHLEFGLWVDEPKLVDHTFSFLLDVLKFSEPLGSAHGSSQSWARGCGLG